MMGADGVVLGTVDEYGTLAHRGRTFPVVGVSIRLIDCESGKIIWSGDLAKRGEDAGIPLAAFSRAVVHELVAGLYQQWGRQKPGVKRTPSESPSDKVVWEKSPAEKAAGIVPELPSGWAVSDMGLREVKVSWKAPAGATGTYRVERAEGDEAWKSLGTVKVSAGGYLDSRGLADGTCYSYRLVPVAPDGTAGSPSSPQESMTAPPPEPPQDVEAVASGSREVTLSWNPPRGVAGVTSYRVWRAPADAPEEWEERDVVNVPRYVDGGRAGCDLLDSTKYLYRVSCINRVRAEGENCTPVDVTTLPPPAAPLGLKAKSGGVKCMDLTWEMSPEDDVTGYQVERALPPADKDAPVEWSPVGNVARRTTTTWCDRNREDGTAYGYRVRAINAVRSESAWSKAAAARTKRAPKAPTKLTTTEDEPESVALTWKPGPEEDVSLWVVEARAADSARWREVARVSETSARHTRVDHGAAFVYRVKAIDADELFSVWSEEAEGAARPLPPTPEGLDAAPGDGGETELTWNAVEGAVAYRVYEKGLFRSTLLRTVETPSAALTAEEVGKGLQVVVTAVDERDLESKTCAPLRVMP